MTSMTKPTIFYLALASRLFAGHEILDIPVEHFGGGEAASAAAAGGSMG